MRGLDFFALVRFILNCQLSHILPIFTVRLMGSMKNAYLMLGNIKILTLSGNLLSNVDGLDRICSLERLDLDGNRIRRVCDMAGLANLPQLMHLSVKGNPIEKKGKLTTFCLERILYVSHHQYL